MCRDCRVQPTGHWEGKRIILEPGRCDCDDCSVVVYRPDGIRCLKCEHLQRALIDLEDASAWEPNPVWIDPRTRRPVRLDAVKRGA